MWCVDLQFHLETFEFMMKVDHAASPWPPLPPYFSLTIPKRQNFTKRTKKKKQKQVIKSFLKENKCMQGWKTQKSTKLDGSDTTTLSHHPYILCHFVNYAHHTTLHMHLAIQGTQLCSLHSPIHKRWPISAIFSSNKFHSITTLQHTTQTQHSSCTAQFLLTVKTDHICHAQYSNDIAATHNITHSPST